MKYIATTALMMQIVYSSDLKSSTPHSSIREDTPGHDDYIQSMDYRHSPYDYQHSSQAEYNHGHETLFRSLDYDQAFPQFDPPSRALAPVPEDAPVLADGALEQSDAAIDEFDQWTHHLIELYLTSYLESYQLSKYDVASEFDVGCDDMAQVLEKTVLSPTKSHLYPAVSPKFAVLMMIICPSYKTSIDTNFKFHPKQLQDVLFPLNIQLAKDVYGTVDDMKEDIIPEKKQLLQQLALRTYPDIHWNVNIVEQFKENKYNCVSIGKDLEMYQERQGYILNEIAALLMILCPQTQDKVIESKHFDFEDPYHDYQLDLYQGMVMAKEFIDENKGSDTVESRLWYNTAQYFASKFVTGTYGQKWKASKQSQRVSAY